MKRTIAGISALAIAAVTAVPALSAEHELSMIEQTTQDTLAEYNVEGVDVMNLTLSQLVQIRDAANSGEPGATIQREIEAIVGE